MIFRPELAKLIVQGKKTMTRRVVSAPTCRYQKGRCYAVQPGRGRSSSARITILAVRSEPLGDLPIKDVRREGFSTRQEFFDYWKRIHGSVDPDLPVWVISFALGDLTDTPRLLAARPGAPHGDYVSNPHLAADGEGEALSEQEQQRFSRLAHARDEQRASDPVRRSRDRLAREIAILGDAVSAGSDVAKTVRRLEKELVVLNRKLAA